MSNAMDDAIDTLCKEIAKQARDPEEAQLITLKALGKLAGTNWQPYFEQLGKDSQTPYLGTTHEIEQRLNEMVKTAIEAQLAQLKAQPAQETTEAPKKIQKKQTAIIPRDLPPGTMTARDFYDRHGVSYGRYRRHTEHGINGKFLETTERRPYQRTRPNHRDRYLTPSQQQKAIEYWEEHQVTYTMPDPEPNKA